MAGVGVVVAGIRVLDIFEIRQRIVQHAVGHFEALGFGAHQGVGHVHRQERPGLVTAFPKREAAVVVLHALEVIDIVVDTGFEFLGRRHVGNLEGSEHITQGRDGDDSRRALLGAFERISDQVQERIGQGLQLRRRGFDFEAAELFDDLTGQRHWLANCAFINDAIGGEGFGGCWCPHRNRELRGIGGISRRCGELEARGAGHLRRGREQHFDAIVGWHRDFAAMTIGDGRVGRAHADAHLHR